MTRVLEAVRLLELTRPFDLNWSSARQRLVNRLKRIEFAARMRSRSERPISTRRLMLTTSSCANGVPAASLYIEPALAR